METASLQLSANRLVGLEELASAKVNEAVAVTFEILNAVPPIAIEEQELLRNVKCDFILEGAAGFHSSFILFVISPVVELPSCEVPEGLDEGGPFVVSISMQAASIVRVHVNAGPAETVFLELLWHVVAQPSAQYFSEGGVLGRCCSNKYGAIIARDATERIAEYNLNTFLHHILSADIVLESPKLQHSDDIIIIDFTLFCCCSLQDHLRHFVCCQASCTHPRSFTILFS
mmetsp:Transcript_26663/g.69670  ORF Transcript_26663/g.69670 Transcript_26663/m.69670 type:complete len:230 (-) Transcript_26663:486-1175(-)